MEQVECNKQGDPVLHPICSDDADGSEEPLKVKA